MEQKHGIGCGGSYSLKQANFHANENRGGTPRILRVREIRTWFKASLKKSEDNLGSIAYIEIAIFQPRTACYCYPFVAPRGKHLQRGQCRHPNLPIGVLHHLNHAAYRAATECHVCMCCVRECVRACVCVCVCVCVGMSDCLFGKDRVERPVHL